jgi:hypothetical protein
VSKLPSAGASMIAGYLGLIAAIPAVPVQAVAEQIAVVELFTSQGCSSCPAADHLLEELARRPDLLALSFPVTYWDYLGWKDTLAYPQYSERQREYAALKGDGQVFTPEAVVNGMQACVGSDRDAIEAALKTTNLALAKEMVSLTLRAEGGRLIIEAGGAPETSQHRRGKVWVASVRRAAPVAIGRGENAGRVVTYTNVVRHLAEAGEWQGAPASYAVPLNAFPKDGDMYVAFLQTEKLGPIVAAARSKG